MWCNCEPTKCLGLGPCRHQAMTASGWASPDDAERTYQFLLSLGRKQTEAAVAAREQTIAHKEVRKIAYEELKKEFDIGA